MSFQFQPYEESDAVKKAQALLQQQLSQKPGSYQSKWQQQLQQTLEKLLNREPFSYDPGSDALYRQYKDQYTRQGRLAMEDAMGQAAALTGGYANSYAQHSGQQAYQSYLQELNALVPELYALARQSYEADGDALAESLSLLQSQEDRDYGRYQDGLDQWTAERNYLQSVFDAQQQRDYSQYTDQRDFSYGQYADDRDFAFRQEQAQQEQARWQAEFDEAKRRYEQQQTAQTAARGGGGSYAGNAGYSAAQVRKAQAFVGAQTDGMWGPNSAAKAKELGYSSLAAVLAALGEGTAQTGGQPELTAYLNQRVSQGASRASIAAIIRSAQSQGYITAAQAQALRAQFTPGGYTY